MFALLQDTSLWCVLSQTLEALTILYICHLMFGKTRRAEPQWGAAISLLGIWNCAVISRLILNLNHQNTAQQRLLAVAWHRGEIT